MAEAESSSAPAQPQLYRSDTRRPAEIDAPSADEEAYHAYRMATDLREPYRIPLPYLSGTKTFLAPDLPEAPLIVFINSKSGGHAGPKLTEALFQSLGNAQVFDLQEVRPAPVLAQIWRNFDAAIEEGKEGNARRIRSRFRILAAGGDGTVAWILKTIQELKLEPPPAVAIMPLGTGNDLSLSFGWGNTFLQPWIRDYHTLYSTLKRVADAEFRALDTWSITLSGPGKDLFKELPHSFDRVKNEETSEVKSLFWNYFSVGMDAEAAYGFHSLREAKPWCMPSRTINQVWYSYYGCASGWFCCAPPVTNKVTLKERKPGGEWTTVVVPPSVKAIVILNLQSYAGGRDLWGLKDTKGDKAKGWKTPIFNDGLIEAVGLKNGYHTALVMGGISRRIHGVRLAQASELMLELKAAPGVVEGESGVAHMQVDGEPWPQEVRGGTAQPLQIVISQSGSSNMLFNNEKLKGMPKKINKLAMREGKVSKAHESSVELSSAASQPSTGAVAASPPTPPITTPAAVPAPEAVVAEIAPEVPPPAPKTIPGAALPVATEPAIIQAVEK